MNFRKKLIFPALLLPLLFLSACFALPTEAVALPPPMLAVPVIPPIPTVAVARGNVQMTANPWATYLPAREERLHFTETDIPIQGIFVSVGDEVTAGDVIAALYMPEVEAKLDDLLRTQSDMQLRLTQVEERRNLALSIAATSGIPVDDTHFLESRASIRADLEILQMDIEYARRLNDTRYLRASMDGVVNRVAPFVIDMRSHPRQLVALITDHDYTAFIVAAHVAEFMHPGNYFNMTLENGTFLMQVVDPDEAGFTSTGFNRFEAFLVFVDAPPALRPGERGQVHMLFEEVYDVLYIPASALHRIEDDRTFVYVMEDGLRTIRDVVVGLEGDDLVEIISGLREGELVIP